MLQQNKPVPFHTDDIVVNYGEVKSYNLPNGRIAWILPGGEITHNKAHAQHVARRINSIIQANMRRRNISSLV